MSTVATTRMITVISSISIKDTPVNPVSQWPAIVRASFFCRHHSHESYL